MLVVGVPRFFFYEIKCLGKPENNKVCSRFSYDDSLNSQNQ